MVNVDKATEADLQTISDLIGEIEEYYGGTRLPGDVDQIRRFLFGPHPVATVLLAREGDEVLGMASYCFLWPAAGSDASLFLKELFVRETARRRGVASSLMDTLRQAATDAGCSRLEWTADRDNPPALSFYEALGAKARDDKIFYRTVL
jgi:GNAT superfamily N-acetyltransferase